MTSAGSRLAHFTFARASAIIPPLDFTQIFQFISCYDRQENCIYSFEDPIISHFYTRHQRLSKIPERELFFFRLTFARFVD